MSIIKFLSILFLISILISCESILTDDASDFCREVIQLNFNGVGNEIEKYLDSVNVYHVETDEFYEIEISKLKNWMETKNCVMKETILGGIIEVDPGIKELSIVFVTTDSTFTKILDIWLDSDLNVKFHSDY